MTSNNFYRLIQGDCLLALETLADESVNTVIADPPYNVGVDEWDNVKYYLHWLLARLRGLERVLKSNGVLWLFHMSFPTLSRINTMLENRTRFRFKQFITINKGLQSIVGRTSFNLRSFPRATEYLVFYTFENRTGAEQLSEKYHKINPMAFYLKSEFKRARVGNRDIAKLFPSRTGGMTGCVSNWLLGLYLPLRSQYEQIREYLNKKTGEADYLKREYDDLKQEYESSRYPFNLEKGVTDVWHTNFYEDKSFSHASAKPLNLIKRVIHATSKPNDVILDPFLGTGTTMEASQHLKRSCIGVEINPDYCEVVKKRCFGRKFLDREVDYQFEVFGAQEQLVEALPVEA